MKINIKKQLKPILISFIAIIAISAGSLYWLNRDVEVASAGWWNDNWSYRKQIVINNAFVTGDLVNFPILASTTDTNLGTHAQADGDDIVFIDSEGEKLSHEIESFSTSTGELWAWVKIPSLSSTNDTVINMYYGNAGVASQQDSERVWDDDYAMVQHLNQTPAADQENSTKSGNDLTNYNLVAGDQKPGQINGSLDFELDDSDYLSLTDTNQSANFPTKSGNTNQSATYSAWIKLEVNNIDTAIMDDNTFAAGGVKIAYYGDALNQIRCYTSDLSFITIAIGNALDAGQWYYITCVADADNNLVTLYVDGAVDNNGADNPKSTTYDLAGTSVDFLVGNNNVASQRFDGFIDEVRVSNIARSAAWIATEYANQASTTEFLSVQAEEVGPGPVGYWSFDTGYGATAYDESGQGNNGQLGFLPTISSTSPTWQDESMCVSGKCLYFDGTNRQYINLTDADQSSNFPTKSGKINQQMTIAGWVKYNSIGSNFQYLTTDFEFNVGGNNFYIDPNDDQLHCTFSGSGSWDAAIGGTDLTTNVWYHIACVIDSANNLATIYLNGAVDTNGASNPLSTTVNLNGTTKAFQIGDSSFVGSSLFNGFIDEVKIYPYARTADEIKMDYVAGLAGIKSNSGVSASFGSASDKWMSDGLVGYWKMDESATTSGATDSSGNGNTGTYGGNASTTAGKFGNGGVFDGVNDYINTGSGSSIDNIWDNGGTVTAWAIARTYPDALGGVIAGKTEWDFRFNTQAPPFNDDSLMFWHGFSGGNFFWTSAAESIQLNTLYHIAVVYNSSSDANDPIFYINGVISPTTETFSTSGTRDTDASANLRLGLNSSGGRDFDGKIDEVRIYNRALSPAEVRKLYEWAPGPVAHWKFDEKTGTTAYDSAASTTFSGGNHGTFGEGSAKPTWSNLGKYGSALEFDGSDSVNMGTDDVLNFTGDFTISSWYKSTSAQLADIQIIAGRANGNYLLGTSDQGYVILARDTGGDTESIQFNIGGIGGTDDQASIIYSGGGIDGQWHYVTGVREGNTAYLYIDGVQVGTDEADVGDVSNSGSIFYVGRGWSAYYLNGSVDDIKAYNYARTQKQILEDMSAGSASGGRGALKQPVLHLNFDEGYGDTANDSSIYNNDGTLNCGTGGSNTATSAMWSLDGKFGKAMEFDGTDDYVNLGDFSTLDGASEATFEAWIWIEDSTSDQIINKWGTSPSYRFKTQTTGDGKFGLLMQIRDSSANDLGVNTTEKIMDINQWYHVAGVWRGGNDANIYINAVDQALTKGTTETPSAIYNTAQLLLVGAEKNGASYANFFDGLIDEVKIYNYALSQDEIKTLYNSGQAAVMGSIGKSNSTATSSNAASLAYCVPGSTDYCAAPVLEFRMDEKTGNTAYDTSGQGNDGQLGFLTTTSSSSPAWKGSGYCQAGNCLEFDGSNDYVEVAYSNNITSGNLTLLAWAKKDVPLVTATLRTVFAQADGGGTGRSWITFDSATGLCAGNQIGSLIGGSTPGLCSQTIATINIWYYVAIVYDGTYKKIYIDGIEEGSVVDTIDEGATGNFIIGGNKDVEQVFSGTIDHVRIYDYARTPAQIAWDFNRGKPIAHWRFDECSGETIYDQSGNGNNGQLQLGSTGVTATGTCASSSDSFWYNGKDGKRNGAGSFDGTDDCVAHPNFSRPTTGLTVSAWAKTNSTATMQIASADDNTGGDRSWQFRENNGYLDFIVFVGGPYTTTVGTTDLSDNQWHHVVGIYDGETSSVYVDGVFEDNDTSMSGNLDSGTGMAIGAMSDSTQTFLWNGLIDEVKIFNYALTAEQIKMEYSGGAVRFGQ